MIRVNSDWLASVPTFYNTKTLAVSTNMNDVIDWSNVEIDSEGLYDYLDFGFSVFQQTPIKNVKFLAPNEELIIDNNQLTLIKHPDPALAFLDKKPTHEDDVLQLIKNKVQGFERSTQGDIILPLSGGYDSRLLASMVEDKGRIKAFSYGISYSQEKSDEVVYAKKVAELLGIEWQQIAIHDCMKPDYLKRCFDAFSCASNNAMSYHVEFYDKFKTNIQPKNALWLSGIFGDAWAGKVPYVDISEFMHGDLGALTYVHGIRADVDKLRLKASHDRRVEYWQANKELLRHHDFQLIHLARLKLLFISFIMELPKHLGFNAQTPFLDLEVVLAIRSLKPERLENRNWQKDYFASVGLDIESMGLKADFRNVLDLTVLEHTSITPLNVNVLREFVSPVYLEWINKTLNNSGHSLKLKRRKRNFMDIVPKGAGILRLLGVPTNDYNLGNIESQAYCAYATLKPLEYILAKREKYGR